MKKTIVFLILSVSIVSCGWNQSKETTEESSATKRDAIPEEEIVCGTLNPNQTPLVFVDAKESGDKHWAPVIVRLENGTDQYFMIAVKHLDSLRSLHVTSIEVCGMYEKLSVINLDGKREFQGGDRPIVMTFKYIKNF